MKVTEESLDEKLLIVIVKGKQHGTEKIGHLEKTVTQLDQAVFLVKQEGYIVINEVTKEWNDILSHVIEIEPHFKVRDDL